MTEFMESLLAARRLFRLTPWREAMAPRVSPGLTT
jgi:hypothetical protein